VIHVLVNTRSGSGEGRRLLNLWSAFRPVVVDPPRIRDQMAGRIAPGDVVVAAGGDGTVSLVVEALFRMGVGSQVSVAVYPIGTGNDLARGLGRAVAVAPAPFMECVAASRVERCGVAVWRFEDRFFLNYLGLGLDAKILAAAESLRRWLPARLALRRPSLVLAGSFQLGFRVRRDLWVETDSGRLDLKGKCGLVASSHLGYFAGGCRIGALEPAARRLSITAFDSRLDFARLVLSRFHGRDTVPTYTTTSSLRIEGEPVPVQIDGEVTDFRTGTIRYAGEAVFLRTPSSTPWNRPEASALSVAP